MWPNDNYAYLVAMQINGGNKPKRWQLIIGYELLGRVIIKRKQLGLCNTQYIAEYKQAKALIYGERKCK
ncbi:MAG: hypothetical protein VX100_07270 [Pseudomonadota bacterium]|nr:hypothetical protein [Pseudomonadota bacterium]